MGVPSLRLASGELMARRQLPLNGEGQTVRFAEQLRRTRGSAGLTLRKLAAVTGYAASTLSAAENGRKLPTWDVASAYVQACGETDLRTWRGRWDAANVEQTGQNLQAESIEEGGPSNPAAATVPTRLWTIVLTALVSAAVTSVAFLTLGRPAETSQSGPSASARQGGSANISPKQINDGTDPKVDGCTADSTTLDTASVILRQTAILHGRKLAIGTKVGTVTLIYSTRCAGAWPLFDPTPGLNPNPTETGVGAVTIEAMRPIDDTSTTWTMGHIDRTYADLLLTGLGCVTAIARVDMVGQNAVATGHTRCLTQP
jgi:transcriptional regulator with XRE-family HTH domain